MPSEGMQRSDKRSVQGWPQRLKTYVIAAVFFLFLLCLSGGVLGVSGNGTSGHDYHNDEWTFLIISFVMTYAASAVVVSLFTLKYGQKRSRYVAVPMLLSGIVLWGVWIYFKFIVRASYPDDTIFGIIYWSTAPILKPLMALIGVIMGAGLSLFIFLTMIVRS
ncbi:MAG TPA: hypothetical protein ENK47_01270 [Euryarchaeota archaeon]|nr:MAG: hypothetical protein DRN57_06480 [Thermoplasmata archaeon]HHD15320.1 hypothetical protein [Euryarchaeota archaeon]